MNGGLGHRRSGSASRLAACALACLMIVTVVVVAGCGGGAEDEVDGQRETAEQGDQAEAAGDPSDSASGVDLELTGLPQLVDLGAGTCGPCKMMAPILDEMSETFEGQLSVVFIDVREDGEAGKRFGISIIPTQIFFDAEGNELFRHQGFFSREDILTKWTELGFEFEG